MADAPKRVAYILRDGRFGTVDEADVPDMPYGTRILTAKQAAQEQADVKQKAADAAEQARYDALPTSQKVLGGINTGLAAAMGPAGYLALGADSGAPPEAGAFSGGVFNGVTAGLGHGLLRQGIDAVAGKEAGDKYAQGVDQQAQASPIARGAGQAFGTVAGVVTPIGEGAEALAAGGLAKVGVKGAGVVSRAGVAASKLGARGLVEGGAIGAGEYAGDQLLHDTDLAVDKLFAATGTSALYGGLTGAVLGGGGSLLASGARGFTDMLAARRGLGASSGEAQRARALIDQSTLDAGINERVTAENPFSFDHQMRLRGDVHQRGKLPIDEPFDIRRGVTIDPDAGLSADGPDAGNAIHDTGKMRDVLKTQRVPFGDIEHQDVWDPSKLPPLRERLANGQEIDPIRLGKMENGKWGIVDGIHRIAANKESGATDILARTAEGHFPQKLNSDVFNFKRDIPTEGGAYRPHYEIGFDPEAGIAPRANGKFQGKIAAEDAALMTANKRSVGLRGDIDAAGVETQAPIKLTQPSARAAAPTGTLKQLSNEMAVDSLGATKKQITNALENVTPDLKTSRQAVGDYMNRQVIGNLAGDSGPIAATAKVGWGGRADELLPLIQADKNGRIGAGLSDALNANPARVSMHDVAQIHADVYRGMLKDHTAIAGAETLHNRLTQEMQALYNAGKVAPDGTIGATDLFYVRSDLAKQAYELGRANGAAGDAYKGFLRKIDRLTIDSIDKSAAAVGKSGVGDNIRYWKREWQLASAAEEMAMGGTERVTGNNVLGIREGIAGATAMMTGHPILGVIGPLAMKASKERGKAMAAYALGQIADRASLAKLVARSDAQIGAAARGLLAPAAKGSLEAHVAPTSTKAVAKTALARVAAFQNDPEKLVEHSSRDVEGIASHSPDIASAIVSRHIQAMTFLSSKVPQQADPDPLDPHAAPHMTSSEQATFARYALYVDKPERFFQEVARGKLTPEGAETAQALMPRAFEQLQAQTAEALALQLSRGNRLPFRQREMLGQLLDFAATPSQRPGHAAFLQQNLADVLPSNDLSSAAPAKSRRSSITPSGSALDRLEAGGPGHR